MLEKLKILLLEEKYPFFTDAQLNIFLEESDNDVYKTASELCYLKADGDKSITVGPIKIDGAGADFWINLSNKYAAKVSTISNLNGRYKTSMSRSDGR